GPARGRSIRRHDPYRDGHVHARPGTSRFRKRDRQRASYGQSTFAGFPGRAAGNRGGAGRRAVILPSTIVSLGIIALAVAAILSGEMMTARIATARLTAARLTAGYQRATGVLVQTLTQDAQSGALPSPLPTFTPLPVSDNTSARIALQSAPGTNEE